VISRTPTTLRHSSLLIVLACAASAANGQSFINPGFETGNFSGWTIAQTSNGQTLVQAVQMVDIDGPGPLLPSLAGKFSVGNIVTMANHQAGIELYQMMNLTAGVEYLVSFNWAALRTTGQVNDEGGVFSIIVGNQVLAMQAAGPTGPLLPHRGLIQGNIIPAVSGEYRVGARITRPFLIPASVAAELHQWVDNFQIVIPPRGACCLNDGSCNFISEFACETLDGVYRGDAVLCGTANCPPPGGCCQFLSCEVLSQRECDRVWGTYYGHGTSCTGCEPQGTLMPLPLQSAISSSDLISRGMWFEAPRDFRITGLRVPDTSGQGVQNIEVVLLPYPPPGSASNPLNSFTSLGRFIGENSGHIIPVSIPVEAGQIIGILGNCGAGTMMHHSSGDGNHQSSVFGNPVRLRRLSMSGNLNTTPAQNIFGSDTLLTVLARIQVYYAEAGPATCYGNCDGSTVEPVLNVDDFTCFINNYAQAQSLPHAQQIEHYANCDGSTIAPALNVDDFTCFINAYAQGCP
jgi:hypothetical protein